MQAKIVPNSEKKYIFTREMEKEREKNILTAACIKICTFAGEIREMKSRENY